MAYLTVGRGSTEWNGVEFKPRDHDELRLQASWALSVISDSIDGLTDSISLNSRRSPLGPAYEAGTVVAQEYPSGQIPSPEQLKADALRMATLLGRVYVAEEKDPRVPGPPPEVVALVNASSLAAGKQRHRSAGFQPDAAQRKAVELRGMEVAKTALKEWGWPTVTDTSSNKPYDFHCQDGEDELYVEVKATTGDGSAVVLTRNEVEHVRTNHPNTALAILSEIVPPTGGDEPATGGTLSFIHPWTVSDTQLSVIAYIYTPSPDEKEPWV